MIRWYVCSRPSIGRLCAYNGRLTLGNDPTCLPLFTVTEAYKQYLPCATGAMHSLTSPMMYFLFDLLCFLLAFFSLLRYHSTEPNVVHLGQTGNGTNSSPNMVSSYHIDLWEHATKLYRLYHWQQSAQLFTFLAGKIDSPQEQTACLLNKALIEARLGDYRDAIYTLSEASQICEHSPIVDFLGALVDHKLGETAAADECFEACLEGLENQALDCSLMGLDYILEYDVVEHNLEQIRKSQLATELGLKDFPPTHLLGLPAECIFKAPSRSTDIIVGETKVASPVAIKRRSSWAGSSRAWWRFTQETVDEPAPRIDDTSGQLHPAFREKVHEESASRPHLLGFGRRHSASARLSSMYTDHHEVKVARTSPEHSVHYRSVEPPSADTIGQIRALQRVYITSPPKPAETAGLGIRMPPPSQARQRPRLEARDARGVDGDTRELATFIREMGAPIRDPRELRDNASAEEAERIAEVLGVEDIPSPPSIAERRLATRKPGKKPSRLFLAHRSMLLSRRTFEPPRSRVPGATGAGRQLWSPSARTANGDSPTSAEHVRFSPDTKKRGPASRPSRSRLRKLGTWSSTKLSPVHDTETASPKNRSDLRISRPVAPSDLLRRVQSLDSISAGLPTSASSTSALSGNTLWPTITEEEPTPRTPTTLTPTRDVGLHLLRTPSFPHGLPIPIASLISDLTLPSPSIHPPTTEPPSPRTQRAHRLRALYTLEGRAETTPERFSRLRLNKPLPPDPPKEEEQKEGRADLEWGSSGKKRLLDAFAEFEEDRLRGMK